MKSREAITALVRAGYSSRMGKGSHVVLRKGDAVIIIPNARYQLSSGLTAKVRSHLARAARGEK